ncbi:MAG: hypothetical protein LBS55_12190 [Prevotellaceae bacterium]|jgi:hypothetical protein|nr:hypothetical protein [Prevotellaceae bacterium]
MGGDGLSNPDWVRQQVVDKGSLVNANWKYGTGGRHSDILRSIKYYRSGKIVMNFRIGSYKFSSFNKDWWFYILKGLK